LQWLRPEEDYALRYCGRRFSLNVWCEF
jgi:hypothetical protein